MNDNLTCIERWSSYHRPEDRDGAIAEHRYLCRRAARRFIRPSLDRADLEQVAAIGLIKAVDRYDRAQQTPFEAYAWLLILGELMHHVRDSERLLRAPRRIRDLEKRWLDAERELSTLLGREPHDADVARFINASPDDQRDVRDYRASGRVASFEALPVSAWRDDAAQFDAVLNVMTLERMFSVLTPIESQIVRSVHIDGTTIVNLARRLGYSRRHLTRLHRTAMTRLRDHSAAVASQFA
jgi:RNA polymerase sigma-B factor